MLVLLQCMLGSSHHQEAVIALKEPSKSRIFGHSLSLWDGRVQVSSHEDPLLPNSYVLLKANQHLSEPHFPFFPFSMAWCKKVPNRLNVCACVGVNKFLLSSPANLSYFISYKLFRTETDASGTHGLYLEMPLEFIITIGNRAFSNVTLTRSQGQ